MLLLVLFPRIFCLVLPSDPLLPSLLLLLLELLVLSLSHFISTTSFCLVPVYPLLFHLPLFFLLLFLSHLLSSTSHSLVLVFPLLLHLPLLFLLLFLSHFWSTASYCLTSSPSSSSIFRYCFSCCFCHIPSSAPTAWSSCLFSSSIFFCSSCYLCHLLCTASYCLPFVFSFFLTVCCCCCRWRTPRPFCLLSWPLTRAAAATFVCISWPCLRSRISASLSAHV